MNSISSSKKSKYSDLLLQTSALKRIQRTRQLLDSIRPQSAPSNGRISSMSKTELYTVNDTISTTTSTNVSETRPRTSKSRRSESQFVQVNSPFGSSCLVRELEFPGSLLTFRTSTRTPDVDKSNESMESLKRKEIKISEMQQCEKLDLSGRNLDTIPSQLSKESHLKLADFQNNQIQKIENLSNLSNLVFLDLYNNQIEVLSYYI